jgi:hypothetical protein
MNDADYEKLLEGTIAKIGQLGMEKAQLETEIAKHEQFFFATLNILSDASRARIEAKWLPVALALNASTGSLTEAVRNVLRTCYPKWLTVANVRDQLNFTGFDFSGYMSNPLASVSTTLRRISESKQADALQTEGIMAYRWKQVPPKKNRILKGRAVPPPPEAEIGTPPSIQNEYERSITGKKK